MAIIEWLEEQYPEHSIMPNSPIQRLLVRQMAAIIASGIQPLQNLKVQKYFSADPTEKLKYSRHWIGLGLKAYENLVQQHAGTYSVGSSISIADICLIPQCYNAARFGIDLDSYPIISKIYHHCLGRADCDRAAPHNQAGSHK